MRNNILFILRRFAVLCFAVALNSCVKDAVSDRMIDGDVYLQIHINGGNSVTTRSQASHPSVNEDTEDGEDFVNKTATVVFDSSTGRKIASHISSDDSFILRMTPGMRDFFFLANYPSEMEALLVNVSSRSELEAAMKKMYSFNTWTENMANRFPMARVYTNQNIAEGGTPHNPVNFQPVLKSSQMLSPVSSYAAEFQNDVTPSTVNLVRACSKITVRLKGDGVDELESIVYKNAAAEYSMMELNRLDNYGKEDRNIQLNGFLQSKEYLKEGVLYVPEKLFPKAGNYWNRDKSKGVDEPVGNVNYLLISMKDGQTFKVPVINNGEVENYMQFSRSSEADYNVVRNQHYIFEIDVPQMHKDIAIKYEVLPWNLNSSVYEFAEAKGKMDIKSSEAYYYSPDKRVVYVHQKNPVYLSFRLKAPVGAIWSVSVTNGLDFTVEPAPEMIVDRKTQIAATSGIVSSEVMYCIKVVPLKDFVGTPRFTQVYVTVAGNEVQVAPGYEGMSPGVRNRTLIKQIE